MSVYDLVAAQQGSINVHRPRSSVGIYKTHDPTPRGELGEVVFK